MLVPLAAWMPVGALTGSPVPWSPASQTGSSETEIRDLIRRANQQQEQAISARDSSAMRDTSTDRYYREMNQVNQTLLRAGVVSVTLVDIDWGAIAVVGDTATAITDETWIATFSDGTIRQSQDRNLYYLVRQNGRWLVEADEHPDDRTPLGPGEKQT